MRPWFDMARVVLCRALERSTGPSLKPLSHDCKTNCSQAVALFIKSAEQGHAGAQLDLALCYTAGRGVDQDQPRAALWYAKAADAGDANAQWNLGWCYANGIGVEQNHAIAIKWYTASADQGHAQAQYNLAHLIRGGP